VRRRKPRREGVVQNLPEPVFADEPTFVPPTAGSGPVDTRPRRRLASLSGVSEGGVPFRAAGQLPTFERAYLVRELRQIGLTSLSLLSLIVVLALILR
jgi:hypothetical protein